MTHIIKNLWEEMEAVERPLFSPQEKLGEGDEVLGEVTDSEQKLYSLWKYEQREMERDFVEFRNSFGEDEMMWKISVQKHYERHKIFSALFWYSVQERLGWDLGNRLAIREGWKIVSVKRQKSLEGLIDFLTGN